MARHLSFFLALELVDEPVSYQGPVAAGKVFRRFQPGATLAPALPLNSTTPHRTAPHPAPDTHTLLPHTHLHHHHQPCCSLCYLHFWCRVTFGDDGQRAAIGSCSASEAATTALVVAATHHSAQQNGALRSQRTATRAREEAGSETYYAPRGLKTLPPGGAAGASV